MGKASVANFMSALTPLVSLNLTGGWSFSSGEGLISHEKKTNTSAVAERLVCSGLPDTVTLGGEYGAHAVSACL